MRELTPREIEELIQEDKIVWVSCRKPYLKLTQGKFVRSPKPDEAGDHLYSFCPYKRGVSLPFLAANAWLISDEEAKEAQSSAISEVMKHFK